MSNKKRPFRPPDDARLDWWPVISVDQEDVPAPIYKALAEDRNVHRLAWDDLFLYHGEEGWVLDDPQEDLAGDWLDTIGASKGFGPRETYWVRVISN